jgi:hypothetical protein
MKMKKTAIVIILTLIVGVGALTIGTPKAQALDIPDICDIVPQLCEQSPSITPIVDEITPTAEITPTEDPSITPVDEVTPTVTPEPTSAPSNNSGDGKGDGKSDGRSDGLCSKPPCVSGNNIPSAPPATGHGE